VVHKWFIADADCGRPLGLRVSPISANTVRSSWASRSASRYRAQERDEDCVDVAGVVQPGIFTRILV
jgi:hypothetical protein